jgi:hypothetical protein
MDPVHNPAHWRKRADEQRSMARGIQDDSAKQTMLDIAAAYERLAALLEAKRERKE